MAVGVNGEPTRLIPAADGQGEVRPLTDHAAGSLNEAMSTLKLYSDDRQALMHSLIATSRADGNVSMIEQVFIEGVMEVLELQPDVRVALRAMLMGDAPLPANAEEFLVEDYDTRLQIFERSLDLALADQEMHPQEHQHLERLIRRLALKHADQDRLWKQAMTALRAPESATS